MAQHWTTFDYLGLGLWIPLIVCLTLILQLGGLQHPWNSGPMICLYVLTPLLLIAYVFRQWKAGDDGLTPGRIMTQRSMITACLYMLFIAYVEAQIPYFVSQSYCSLPLSLLLPESELRLLSLKFPLIIACSCPSIFRQPCAKRPFSQV